MAKKLDSGYIPEINGLRGLALALVVFFHLLGQGRVSGGVDVFLFLSGFLLTLSLLRKVDRTGSFSVTNQYGRTLRRLVPAALLVLAAVAIATVLISPRPSWAQVGSELVASALYFENWELINSQLAYGAAGPETSPLQHFWSMSVQGQFFLIWPLTLLIISMLVKRWEVGFARTVGVVSAALTLASFAWAQTLSTTDQAVNYLHSGSRLWQLTLGALLATVYPHLRTPARLKAALGWVGLSMIVLSGFLFDGAQHFPAFPALLPVLGAALVVAGSGPDGRFSVRTALGTRPLAFLADISYPLYLWHWPILIFYMEYRGLRVIGLRSAMAILATSIALAWLTQALVARPALANVGKLSAGRLALPVLVPLIGLALAAGSSVMALRAWEERELAELPQGVSPYYPGALVLTGEAVEPPDGWSTRPVPGLAAAQKDLPDLYSEGCIQSHRDEAGTDEVLICPDQEVLQPHKRVVLSGGSHAIHWYDALKEVAKRQQWELLVVDKDGCRLAMATKTTGQPSACQRWNEAARDVIRNLDPDAVFTVGTRTPGTPGQVENVADNELKVWDFFSQNGIPTIVFRDTPRFLERVPECLARAGLDNSRDCGRSESDIYQETNPLEELARPAGIVPIDLRHAFCKDGFCDVVIGNVVAYRDADHMTATYSTTLQGALERELEEEAPWLFEPGE